LGDVAAKQSVQGGTNVEGQVICLLLGCAGRWQFADRDRRGLPQPLEDSLDAHVTNRHFGLVDVVQLQRLGQGEDMLFAIIADQRLADRLQRGMAPRVAIGGQHRRVTLPGYDRADDGHAGRTGDVGHHVMKLQVHLHQRLLHVLDVRGGIVQQSLALAQCDGPGRLDRFREK
jgi:hypothetical protein